MPSKVITISSLLGFVLSFSSYSSAAQEVSEVAINKSIVVDSKKDQVWAALTSENELGVWWNEGVKLEPRVGGEFYEPWGEGQLATGLVIDVRTSEMIQFTWHERYWNSSEKTICTFTLIEIGDATRLEVKHSGWESFQDLERRAKLVEGFQQGWDFLLPKLKRHLEKRLHAPPEKKVI